MVAALFHNHDNRQLLVKYFSLTVLSGPLERSQKPVSVTAFSEVTCRDTGGETSLQGSSASLT